MNDLLCFHSAKKGRGAKRLKVEDSRVSWSDVVSYSTSYSKGSLTVNYKELLLSVVLRSPQFPLQAVRVRPTSLL